MAEPKYKKHYQEMLAYNKELFDLLKSTRGTPEFEAIQNKVLRIVREYDNALCSRSETTGYNRFASTLSDKFMMLVRDEYPEIDYIN